METGKCPKSGWGKPAKGSNSTARRFAYSAEPPEAMPAEVDPEKCGRLPAHVAGMRWT